MHKISLLKTTKFLVVFTLTIFITSCAQVSQVADPKTISVNLSGLTLDPSQAPTIVYKREGATTLANYKKFILDPLSIDYKDPKLKDISSSEIKHIQNYFTEIITQELVNGGYKLVTRSAPDVLRMTFSIKELKAPSASTNVSMLLIPGLSTSVGEVTIQAVFTESHTNIINAVVLESSRGSYMFNANPLTTVSDVEVAFDNWAKGLRKAIDKAHE
jgi:hypothetical protein